MAAGTYNFTIEQGTDWSLVLTWKDEAGNPINLTGYTAHFEVRSTVSSATTILDLSTGSGIALGGAAGTITLTRNNTQTSALNFGTAPYSLELTAGSGAVTRLLKGYVTLSKEVVR